MVSERRRNTAVERQKAEATTEQCSLSAKLHYTDTGYGHVLQHHQLTSLQQFYNLLYNRFTTDGQKFATSQHLDMSRCWALALRCGKFVAQPVVELMWACPLVVLYTTCTVAGVRVVEFGTNELSAASALWMDGINWRVGSELSVIVSSLSTSLVNTVNLSSRQVVRWLRKHHDRSIVLDLHASRANSGVVNKDFITGSTTTFITQNLSVGDWKTFVNCLFSQHFFIACRLRNVVVSYVLFADNALFFVSSDKDRQQLLDIRFTFAACQ